MPTGEWPATLRAATGICLHSRFPICLFWGPRLAMIYNDAFRPILGENKHPAGMGTPAQETWAEIWDYIGPLLTGVMETGENTGAEDLRLLLDRNGYLEETYFTFSYSAIRDDEGTTRGVFVVVTETTSHVVSERRLGAAAMLADRTADAGTVDAVVAGVLAGLGADPDDIPWAQLLLDGQVIGEVGSERPEAVLRLPVRRPGLDGELIVGVAPQLPRDGVHREFLELLADQIAAALAGARRTAALEALDQAKTAFFSNVSHEFRTPLTLMLGPLSDALLEELPERQRERVETAHRSAERLLRLVNSLLDVARLEAGNALPSSTAVDLAHQLREAAGGFRSLVEQAGLKLSVEAPEAPVVIPGDRDMAEKIVFNLLSNAFKFTTEGEIRVRLTSAGGHAALTVADTGVGLAADELPHLFERFHRGRAATGRSHEGTGIGLALVRELVLLHGGTIDVESEPGAGSTFTVTLPLAPAGTVALDEPLDPHGAATVVGEAARWVGSTTPEGAGASVLVADDNADMRDYLARLLGDVYAVETVVDGRAALERARAGGLDLVLTDVMMPGLDGFALLKELRADPRTRRLPVIMVSARAGEDAAVEGLDAGADDYLVKPFAASELRARVRATLELARLRDELDRRADAAEQVAEALQRSLLPDTLPALPELALAGRYVPAGRELRVGGDWYDAIPLPDGQIVLAIGDVAGHGVRAAAIMGQVSHALRAYAAEGHGPADLVRRLDALVLSGGLEMVTCLCAKLNPATGELRWVSAGHLPPLIAGGHHARILEGPVANPLGVIVGSRHEEGEAVLEDGETLVLYTDGLIERRDRPIDDGLAALAAALSPDGRRPEALCDAVLATLLGGAAPADDVALLVARRVRLTGPSAALTIPADPGRLRDVRHWLSAWLRGNGFAGRATQDLILAVHEASMNAVEHAYGSDPGTVEIRARRIAGGAEVEIRDRGRWRASRPTPNDRGRGEALMRALAGHVEIERGDDGSRVSLRAELHD